MRFFDNLGRQAFRTAPDGQRLFYSFGPWSRPYVVPDADTEQRLSGKQRWLLVVMLVLIVVGQQLVRSFGQDVISTVAGFVGYLAFVWIGYAVVQRILFHGDLRSLARAESRLSFHDYYADVAARRSMGSLMLQVGLSLGFIALGVWLVVGQRELVLGWAAIGLFSVFAGVWIYALSLKLSQRAR